MQVKDAAGGGNIARYINLAVLAVAICFVFFFPVNKQVWYDETVSMLCSKGLYYTADNALTTLPANSSAVLAEQNTAAKVYNCTIIDNGNSFLYNEALHVYTNIFGNTTNSYMWLSKLCAAGVLIALFFFCTMLWGNSIFTSLALVLISSDTVFWGMAHEIRAYEMGMMFIILAAIFCHRYMYKSGSSTDLFMCGLLSVAAVLCHYLSAYAVLVLVGFMVFTRKKELLRPKNIVAIAVPVILIAVYFALAAAGFSTMNKQNAAIAARKAAHGEFAIGQVITKAMKFSAGNFRFVEATFVGSVGVIVLSFLFIFVLYGVAIRFSSSRREKLNLHLLFLLGISGTLFLSALCIKSHHYTALYFRYFSFCVPFAILFTVYGLYILYTSNAVKKLFSMAAVAIVLLPALLLFSKVVRGGYPVKYNHIAVSKTVTDLGVEKIVAPGWMDAFLVQSTLPAGYKLQYVVDTVSKNFVLIKTDTVKKIPVVRVNS